MKINEEILSELINLRDEKLKDFLLWLLDFERDIAASKKPEFKKPVEGEIAKILKEQDAENK